MMIFFKIRVFLTHCWKYCHEFLQECAHCPNGMCSEMVFVILSIVTLSNGKVPKPFWWPLTNICIHNRYCVLFYSFWHNNIHTSRTISIYLIRVLSCYVFYRSFFLIKTTISMALIVNININAIQILLNMYLSFAQYHDSIL